MLYRALTALEIAELESRGCRADNWNLITVKEGFNPKSIYQVSFAGTVQLGALTHSNHVNHPTGIYYSSIEQCTIEDNVRIFRVGRLSNCLIRSNSTIENCQSITSDDNPMCGNGSSIPVLIETGGRDVVMYEGLTAQIAYLLTFARHKPQFINQLNALIHKNINTAKTERSIIGHHVNIAHCKAIHNVKINDYARLEGVTKLQNGTILSSQESPSFIGCDVIANTFIIGKGSVVADAAQLHNCFVGECCSIEKQFSAENSLFFANTQMHRGEACSAFAAPFTISHHKSSLLIAGYFAFTNFGSGSNQSNHMYKLGPLHQGIMERGCKLSSDSYVLWPAKIGAFTFVMGRHYSNPDTSKFPFSFLLDENGTSFLVPAANLRQIGTLRDAAKWPLRDGRKDLPADLIHFDLFNPYTISRILKGREALTELETLKKDQKAYLWGDVKIKKPALKRGLELYDEALRLYAGDLLYKKFCSQSFSSAKEFMLQVLYSSIAETEAEWMDLAGMIAPASKIDQLIHQTEIGEIKSLSTLLKRLKQIHHDLPDDEWTWFIDNLKPFTGISYQNLSPVLLQQFLTIWKNDLSTHLQMQLKDAQKEFSDRSKTSFGFNDKPETKQSDFESVRSDLNSHPFIHQIKKLTEEKVAWANKTIQLLAGFQET
jgi:hypothetical protein